MNAEPEAAGDGVAVVIEASALSRKVLAILRPEILPRARIERKAFFVSR